MNKKQYIQEIVDRACLTHGNKYRRKLIEDLQQEFDSLLEQGYSEKEAMKQMGKPDDIAAGIYDNYISAEEVSRPFIEYTSNQKLFGMPLVHIVKGKRQEFVKASEGRHSLRGVPTAKGFIAIGRRARGIIAIGNFTCGIISIGNISVGVLSISNIGFGLLCFGNLAIGLLMALGNAALGALAVGNLAAGYGAVGNVGIGWYAIGHRAFGNISLEVKSFSRMNNEIQSFISSLPTPLQSFFQATVALVQNWMWLFIVAGIIIALLLIAWGIISHWLETERT